MKMRVSHIAVCTLLLALLVQPQISMALDCKPAELSPCVSAITTSTPPSQLCCAKIKEQKPCLCEYLKNPAFQKFVNSPNSRKVADTCGTPYPKC